MLSPLSLCLDDEEPKLTCPIDMEIKTMKGVSYGKIQYDIPEASDNVDQQMTVNCDPSPGFKLEEDSAKVTCSVSDNAGNTKKCSFDVTLIGK